MADVVFVSVVLQALVCGAAQTSVLDRLSTEAAELRSKQPQRWQEYLDQAARAFAENEELRRDWRYRAPPPPADLKPFKLPLSFLVEEAKHEMRGPRLESWVNAIAAIPGAQRADALDELRERLKNVGRIPTDLLLSRAMVAAADLPWAQRKMGQLLQEKPHLSREGLFYLLLNRFAQQLPQALRQAAFDYVRRHYEGGPSNGDGDVYWDLLLRLDLDLARREMIGYYGLINKWQNLRDCDTSVVQLLTKYASPSAEVAAAVDRWCDDIGPREREWGMQAMLCELLLKSVPPQQLPSALRRLDQLAARIDFLIEKKHAAGEPASKYNGGELDDLLQGMVKLDRSEAVPALLRYANEPVVNALTRFKINEWLDEHERNRNDAANFETVRGEWARCLGTVDAAWLERHAGARFAKLKSQAAAAQSDKKNLDGAAQRLEVATASLQGLVAQTRTRENLAKAGPVIARFEDALARGNKSQAQQALGELERLIPCDQRLNAWQAKAGAMGLPEISVTLEGGVTMEFALIPAGSFSMGAGPKQQRVTLSKPFYLGKYEVTQQQWGAMFGAHLSYHRGAKNPVDNASWEDSQRFVTRLNSMLPGLKASLPTEAQWEYACRAGSTTRFCCGDEATSLGDYAWYSANSGGATHAVGQKKPNAWGLYDMHGNVWEWCSDWYEPDPAPAGQAPRDPDCRDGHVLRGGSFGTGPSFLASSSRSVGVSPGNQGYYCGLRVVLTADGPAR